MTGFGGGKERESGAVVDKSVKDAGQPVHQEVAVEASKHAIVQAARVLYQHPQTKPKREADDQKNVVLHILFESCV